jgi:hypothetical protein
MCRRTVETETPRRSATSWGVTYSRRCSTVVIGLQNVLRLERSETVTSGSCGSLGAPLALLPNPLQLHDVRDVERLAQSVLTRAGLSLSYHDNEDALAFLVEEAWLASTRYEPAQGVRFSTYCTTVLQRRVVDWQRKRFGRTVWKIRGREYRRERPAIVSLDAGLLDAQRTGAGDPADGGGADLSRLLAGGSSTRTRDLETLNLRDAG